MMRDLETNVLYYGDNLEILRRCIPNDSIDLAYLEPPFDAKTSYDDLFRHPRDEFSEARIKDFHDTWHWTMEAERSLEEICRTAPATVINVMQALLSFLGKNDLTAYLIMVSIRLLEIKRVLKVSGSVYLYCDTIASHYLRILMDAIFGCENFRNELVRVYQRWKTLPTQFQRMHDSILFYSKSAHNVFNLAEGEGPESQQENWGRDWDPNVARADERKSLRMVDHACGSGRTVRGTSSDSSEIDGIAFIRGRRPLNASDVWGGRPFQKLENVYERIIETSSNEGDVILDPFCGTGTTLLVAHRLNRKWVGIDITHLAISITKWRLQKTFSSTPFGVIGEPADLTEAKVLFEQDRRQFRCFVLSLIDARRYSSVHKEAQIPIDGCCYFVDEKGKLKKAIVQVRSGHVSVRCIKRLNELREKEGAEIGIMLTLKQPTKSMREEAKDKGFYHSVLGQDYPRLQILTLEECLAGGKPALPSRISPVSDAKKAT